MIAKEVVLLICGLQYLLAFTPGTPSAKRVVLSVQQQQQEQQLPAPWSTKTTLWDNLSSSNSETPQGTVPPVVTNDDDVAAKQSSPLLHHPGDFGLSETSMRETLLKLAQLSLEDYKWRSSVFKSNEADRMVEDMLARMQGRELAPYIRPMDASASTIGPLGRWEKSMVDWLSQVIDEEGRRAQKIIDGEGKLVRPMESSDLDNNLGPLGYMEQKASEFLQSIRASERERARTNTLRPMNLEESIRGPLGRMEEAVSRFFQDIRESENMRLEQSRSRGGDLVRPIDVPGPLGELELLIGEVMKAEEQRAMELNRNEGKILRPKDARVRGPLGEAEQSVFDLLDQLSAEEKQRLRNIRLLLQERRPMENDRTSFLGLLEALLVGIIRAPLLFVRVVDRVRELMSSEYIEELDSTDSKEGKGNRPDEMNQEKSK